MNDGYEVRTADSCRWTFDMLLIGKFETVIEP